MAKLTFAQRGFLASTALGSLAGMASLFVGAAGLTITMPGAAMAQEHHHHHHNNANNNANNNNNNNAAAANAAADPGPRGGAAGAGGPLAGLNSAEVNFFNAAKAVFSEVDSVSGTITGEAGVGLGPRFNHNSCAGCHLQPDVGGSSPNPNTQPQFGKLDGATNTVPSFITANGPTREVRFPLNPDGTPDGGVHDLFTITGRTDATQGGHTCKIDQPDFAGAVAANNIIFRTPTPTFGLGLVENTSDSNLQAAFDGAPGKAAAGVSGHFNHSGNDGTITRFGWKAQNKSLLIFAGEAYNVEQGVTNNAFGNTRENDPNCQFNGDPESPIPMTPGTSGTPADFQEDIENFAAYMRFLAPPTPASTQMAAAGGHGVAAAAAGAAAASAGQTTFTNIGCASCHVPSQTTANSVFTGQSMVTYQPYSDFACHNMGTGLADRVSQGGCGGQEFRSAPLWGVGQRLFLLHDGRTADMVEAIHQHASTGSEANGVVNAYDQLSTTDQQNLLDFLRSL